MRCTTVPFILVVCNDTGLRQQIAVLQENYTTQLSHGWSSSGGISRQSRATIVASVTDGFRMDIMLDNIGSTHLNC